MTVIQLVIVPGVILAAVGGVIIWLVARLLAAHLKAARASLSLSQAWHRQYERDRDALASVITELESRPATYSTFPQELRDAIYAAHSSAADLERKSR